jgi:hypothetical protein
LHIKTKMSQKLTLKQLVGLKNEFVLNNNPSSEILIQISEKIGLPVNQVSKWFEEKLKFGQNKFSNFLRYLSKETNEVLTNYFNQNMQPSTVMLFKISNETGINVNQARKWFNIERQKYYSKTDVIKIRRPTFDKNQKKIINDYFEKDMYPPSEIIQSLASETNLSVTQVRRCFQNKRNKLHSELSIRIEPINKNKRFEFDKINYLQDEFDKDAYPSKKMRKIIAENANLSYEQVRIWFNNNRIKHNILKI